MSAREPLDEISDGPEDDGPDYVPPPVTALAISETADAEFQDACRVLAKCRSEDEVFERAAGAGLSGKAIRRWIAENLNG